MVRIEPFEIGHYQYFCIASMGRITYPQMRAIETSGQAYTILDGEHGLPLAFGGITPYWEGRGEAWVVFNRKALQGKFLGVFRLIKEFLDVAPFSRVEASVELESHTGHRLVQSLGFKLEAAKLEKYLADGKDASLYARIK